MKKDTRPSITYTGDESLFELLDKARLALRKIGIYNTWHNMMKEVTHSCPDNQIIPRINKYVILEKICNSSKKILTKKSKKIKL